MSGDPPYVDPAQYPQGQPPPQTYWPAYPVAPVLPKPGSMPVGPNDFGSIFGATFGTFQNLWKPVLVAIVPAVALTAILVATLGTVIARLAPTLADRMDGVDSVGDFFRAVPHFFALTIGGSLGYIIIATYCLAVLAGTARAAGRAIAGDRVPALYIVQSAVRAAPRVLTWIGVCAVLASVVAGLGLLAFVASSETSQRIAYVGILALVVGVVGAAIQVVYALKLEFLVPAMMLEPRSADPSTGVVASGSSRPLGLIQAARRSWRLTTGRVWRTVGITLLIGMPVGIGPGIVSNVVNVATSLLTVSVHGPVVYVVAYTIYFTVVVGLYLAAAMVQTIGQTVLYTDARIRDEGIAPAILDHASTGSPADPWVRWHERY